MVAVAIAVGQPLELLDVFVRKRVKSAELAEIEQIRNSSC